MTKTMKFITDELKDRLDDPFVQTVLKKIGDTGFGENERILIVNSIKHGYDILDYITGYTSVEKIIEIIRWKEDGLDPSKYCGDEYSVGHMRYLRCGLNSGYDVKLYDNPSFRLRAVCAIYNALERIVDVAKYIEKGYNGYQIEEISAGISVGLDVSIYDDKKYNDCQMREIRIGLEEGLNVSRYADPELNETQMKDIRETMMKERENLKEESPTTEQLKWCRDYAISRINNLSDKDLWKEMYREYYRMNFGSGKIHPNADQLDCCRGNAVSTLQSFD